MRKLLRFVCLFRGHKPVPCACILCTTGTFGLHAHHCQRCDKLLWLGPTWDNVVIEWEPDDVWASEEPWNRPQEEWPQNE